jgi:hypothetical protein
MKPARAWAMASLPAQSRRGPSLPNQLKAAMISFGAAACNLS